MLSEEALKSTATKGKLLIRRLAGEDGRGGIALRYAHLRRSMATILLAMRVLLDGLSSASACEIKVSDLVQNLSLNFEQFDQTIGQGARAYAAKDCFFEAGQITDLWHLHHADHLDASQAVISFFHAGQYYAFAGQEMYPVAIARFEKAIKKNESGSSPLTWNAYIRATIAFLKGNLNELRKARIEMNGKTHPDNQMNMRVVDGMIKCFGKSYREAYSATACRAI